MWRYNVSLLSVLSVNKLQSSSVVLLGDVFIVSLTPAVLNDSHRRRNCFWYSVNFLSPARDTSLLLQDRARLRQPIMTILDVLHHEQVPKIGSNPQTEARYDSSFTRG